MADRSSDFWNFVHRDRRVEWCADHPVKYFTDLFDRVGPFSEDLRGALSVLDVGPGYAQVLRSLPEHVRKYAVEVSEENRKRLGEHGIAAMEPGVQILTMCGVHLAWSVSCLPHCEWEMVRTLLHQVAAALVPGGRFYAESVDQREGFPDCPEEARLLAGRYWVPVERMVDEARLVGFDIENVVNVSLGEACPLTSYLMRLRKI